MKLLDLIPEARRNPELNNQKKGHDGAAEFLSAIPADELDSYGVTLTDVLKLGINPQSPYDTPLAICFYPARYYMKKKLNQDRMEFADSSPYIQIIKLSGNVVNLSDNSSDIFNKGVSLLKANASTIAKLLRLNEASVIQNIDISLKFANRQASVKSEAGMFWYVLYHLAKVANSREDVDHGKREYDGIAGLMPIAWNKIMRIIGIDVALDLGNGILHNNEPWQGMAFNPTAVKTVKMFVNSTELYRPSPMNKVVIANNSNPEKYIKTVCQHLFGNGPTKPLSAADKNAIGVNVFKFCNASPELYKLITLPRILELSGYLSDGSMRAKLLVDYVRHVYNWSANVLSEIKKKWEENKNKSTEHLDRFRASLFDDYQWAARVLAFLRPTQPESKDLYKELSDLAVLMRPIGSNQTTVFI